MTEEQTVLCLPRVCIADRERFTPWRMAAGVIRLAAEDMQWLPRREAEAADDLIQPIPCALVVGKNHSYHVFRRIAEGRPDLRRRVSLVVGGHIDEPQSQRDIFSLLSSTLKREITEELGIHPPEKTKPIGMVVDFSSTEASRHIGIVHEIEIEGRATPRATEEFSVRSKHVRQLYSAQELFNIRGEFDPWSRIIFGNYLRPSNALEFGNQLCLIPD